MIPQHIDVYASKVIMKILVEYVYLVQRHVEVVVAQLYVLHALQGLLNQEIYADVMKVRILSKILPDIVKLANRIVKFAIKQEIVQYVPLIIQKSMMEDAYAVLEWLLIKMEFAQLAQANAWRVNKLQSVQVVNQIYY